MSKFPMPISSFLIQFDLSSVLLLLSSLLLLVSPCLAAIKDEDGATEFEFHGKVTPSDKQWEVKLVCLEGCQKDVRLVYTAVTDTDGAGVGMFRFTLVPAVSSDGGDSVKTVQVRVRSTERILGKIRSYKWTIANPLLHSRRRLYRFPFGHFLSADGQRAPFLRLQFKGKFPELAPNFDYAVSVMDKAKTLELGDSQLLAQAEWDGSGRSVDVNLDADAVKAHLQSSRMASAWVFVHAVPREVCQLCGHGALADNPLKRPLHCQHYFHANCINKWLNSTYNKKDGKKVMPEQCPVCANAADMPAMPRAKRSAVQDQEPRELHERPPINTSVSSRSTADGSSGNGSHQQSSRGKNGTANPVDGTAGQKRKKNPTGARDDEGQHSGVQLNQPGDSANGHNSSVADIVAHQSPPSRNGPQQHGRPQHPAAQKDEEEKEQEQMLVPAQQNPLKFKRTGSFLWRSLKVRLQERDQLFKEEMFAALLEMPLLQNGNPPFYTYTLEVGKVVDSTKSKKKTTTTTIIHNVAMVDNGEEGGGEDEAGIGAEDSMDSSSNHQRFGGHHHQQIPSLLEQELEEEKRRQHNHQPDAADGTNGRRWEGQSTWEYGGPSAGTGVSSSPSEAIPNSPTPPAAWGHSANGVVDEEDDFIQSELAQFDDAGHGHAAHAGVGDALSEERVKQLLEEGFFGGHGQHNEAANVEDAALTDEQIEQLQADGVFDHDHLKGFNNIDAFSEEQLKQLTEAGAFDRPYSSPNGDALSDGEVTRRLEKGHWGSRKPGSVSKLSVDNGSGGGNDSDGYTDEEHRRNKAPIKVPPTWSSTKDPEEFDDDESYYSEWKPIEFDKKTLDWAKKKTGNAPTNEDGSPRGEEKDGQKKVKKAVELHDQQSPHSVVHSSAVPHRTKKEEKGHHQRHLARSDSDEVPFQTAESTMTTTTDEQPSDSLSMTSLEQVSEEEEREEPPSPMTSALNELNFHNMNSTQWAKMYKWHPQKSSGK